MSLRRIFAIIHRHRLEAMRNPDRIADVLFWPFLDVVTWSFFSRYLLHSGFAAPAELVCGIALWGAFRAYQRDMAVGFLGEIWSRNIAGLFASPLSIGEYLAGLALVNLAKLFLALGMIALACHLVSGVPDLALLLALLAPLAILLVSGAAVGLFVTALILRFTARVQTLAYGLAGLLMPVSCVFYSVAALPAWLRPVAGFLPTTQAFEAMRQGMRGLGLPGVVLLRGGAGALVALLVALLFFRGMMRAARRSGRLVRMD